MTIEEFESRRYLEQLSKHMFVSYKILVMWRDVHGMTYKEMVQAHRIKYPESYYRPTPCKMRSRYLKALQQLKNIADQEALLCAEKCHI